MRYDGLFQLSTWHNLQSLRKGVSVRDWLSIPGWPVGMSMRGHLGYIN